MVNVEKVIKGLELCKQDTKLCFSETECPYQCEFPRCCQKLIADALELLKKHAPKRMLDVGTHELRNKHKIYYGLCPSCKRKLYYKSSNFCLWCGQAVKWDD